MPDLERLATVISVSALILWCAIVLSFKSESNRRMGKLILVIQMVVVSMLGTMLFIGYRSLVLACVTASVVWMESEYAYQRWRFPVTRQGLWITRLAVIVIGTILANII